MCPTTQHLYQGAKNAGKNKSTIAKVDCKVSLFIPPRQKKDAYFYAVANIYIVGKSGSFSCDGSCSGPFT